ncbi:hypothetical protein M408DRAFT_223507 [Serendipita vermifera MAFF 305830]|uniref:Uncharacterized protein n=1 Tax=Serendipita vermifera MAFF 305830 TaxID=933852 RepID=A0A0C2WFB6_SERVB|nr:hypothetical protein M408DRAFT_223507 [Serendipita vermifera MAFF 305830]
MKKLIQRALNKDSGLSSQLSTSCAVAISSTAAFSSASFIAAHHETMEKEESHVILQPVSYHNYIIDGRAAKPLFGLGKAETVALVKRVMDRAKGNDISWAWDSGGPHEAFQFEERALSTEDITSEDREFNLGWDIALLEVAHTCLRLYDTILITLHQYAFRFDEPLIPLSTGEISRYQSGVPRHKLVSLLKDMDPCTRPEIISLMVRLVDMRNQPKKTMEVLEFVALRFVHNSRARSIIQDIWRKWDIVNDQPLPDGFERFWDAETRVSKVKPQSELKNKQEYGHLG